MLELLELSQNFISGTIPASLGNLKKLPWFSVQQFSEWGYSRGSVQEPVSGANVVVYLHYNKLSGSIPYSVGEMTRIRSLWLQANTLSGVLPDSIGNCTKLEELYLLVNQLSGCLPETLSEIKGLRFLTRLPKPSQARSLSVLRTAS
ncbi:hypothetical protein PAHAL_6G221300 [Panicum hallii]|jgi:hypothetical protein|uniref:Leucine-rich repeat-containing N-terminal plant-type domain-containing protein n=1 Tax=Panicum hallii TaxID=206008 RepID=A0A2S3I2X4_9POAL|nr:hypothetical protein PAHAL_6G221300 [Panicum hallii]